MDGSSYFFGGLAAQIVWHGLRAGGHPALSLRSFNGVGRMDKVQGAPSFRQNNFPVTVKIRTSGCQTLECFIATLPA